MVTNILPETASLKGVFQASKTFKRIVSIRDCSASRNFSDYIRLTFEPSEMSNYSKIAGIWPKIIIFQV